MAGIGDWAGQEGGGVITQERERERERDIKKS
jgi:hypothetical protein